VTEGFVYTPAGGPLVGVVALFWPAPGTFVAATPIGSFFTGSATIPGVPAISRRAGVVTVSYSATTGLTLAPGIQYLAIWQVTASSSDSAVTDVIGLQFSCSPLFETWAFPIPGLATGQVRNIPVQLEDGFSGAIPELTAYSSVSGRHFSFNLGVKIFAWAAP